MISCSSVQVGVCLRVGDIFTLFGIPSIPSIKAWLLTMLPYAPMYIHPSESHAIVDAAIISLSVQAELFRQYSPRTSNIVDILVEFISDQAACFIERSFADV